MTVPETQPAPLRRDRSQRDRSAASARASAGGSGIDPLILRIGFVLAAAVGGLGVALYVALLGADAGRRARRGARPLMARAVGRRESWMVACGLVLLMLAVLLLFRAWGVWVGDAIVWPLILATGGGALIWRQSQGATVVEPPRRASRRGRAAARAGRGACCGSGARRSASSRSARCSSSPPRSSSSGSTARSCPTAT